MAFKWPCSSHIQSCSVTCRGCSPPSQVIELHPEILEGHLWFSRSPPRTSGGLSMACVVYSQPSRAQKGTQNLCRAFYLWRLFWSMHAGATVQRKGFRVFGNAVLEHLKAFLWPVETVPSLYAPRKGSQNPWWPLVQTSLEAFLSSHWRPYSKDLQKPLRCLWKVPQRAPWATVAQPGCLGRVQVGPNMGPEDLHWITFTDAIYTSE